MAECLEYWNCDPQSMSSIPTLLLLTGFVLGSPEFDSLIMLVYSKLVCFWPVEILSLLGHNEYYWFTINCVTPIWLVVLVALMFGIAK